MSVKTRKPDFIGIGAMKAGTSWLAACLRAHDQICLPKKDLNFWSKDPSPGDIQEYEERFGRCSQEKICGEFSTSYLTSARALRQISSRYPETKIIMILREPADRAISHYKHLMRYGKIPKSYSIWDAINKHSQIIDRGRYGKYVSRWLQVHRRNLTRVLLYDSLLDAPISSIQSIYRFLKVNPLFVPALINQRVNAGGVPRSQWVEKSLFRLRMLVYKRIPGVPSFWWSRWCVKLRETILSMNRERGEVFVTEIDKQVLKGIYLEDVERLEKVLGWELPEGWR